MDESAKHDTETNAPTHLERVLIEDYRGPATELPSSAPQARQLTEMHEIKREPITVEYPRPTWSQLRWPDVLSGIGAVLGYSSLLLMIYGFHLYVSSYSNVAPLFFNSIMNNPSVPIAICLAILGFIFCILARLRYRTARNQRIVLTASLMGLVMNGAALLIVMLGYLLGW